MSFLNRHIVNCYKNVDNQLQAKQNILQKILLINRRLDLSVIAYSLERGCKYEVKSWNEKRNMLK